MRGGQDRDLVLDLWLERAGDQALGKGTAHHRIDDADTASLCDQLARGREELRLRNDIPARAVFGKGGRKLLVDGIAAKQGDERDLVKIVRRDLLELRQRMRLRQHAQAFV